MILAVASTTLINGFVLGWSVAWPPGPVNAEMLRRSVIPRAQGGGFWAAWRVRQGGRIFTRPAWQAATQAITSLLMLFFAGKLLLTLS